MPQPDREVFWPATRNDIYWILWCSTALIALIMLSRAASGAWQPVTSGWAFVVVTIGVGVNLLLWWWSLPSGWLDAARAQIARGAVAVCPPLVLAGILAGNSVLAWSGILAVVAGGLALVIAVTQQRFTAQETEQLASDAAPAFDIPVQEALTDITERPVTSFDDATVNQQIIRRSGGTGESLEALLRLEFVANQRETSIHIPIEPAMSGQPQVECEPLDETSIEFKVAATHPYGVRIEMKRTGSVDEPATIPVGILISSVAAAAAA